jgi:hypothetical protein
LADVPVKAEASAHIVLPPDMAAIRIDLSWQIVGFDDQTSETTEPERPGRLPLNQNARAAT